jgi:ABC-type transport system involved in Fe-S cluster assembly fused permease/ATPase subunit
LGAVFANRTVFVIAHRLSAVMQADRIVVLENGCVTQIGAHDQAVQREGYYRTMAMLQSMQDTQREPV